MAFIQCKGHDTNLWPSLYVGVSPPPPHPTKKKQCLETCLFILYWRYNKKRLCQHAATVVGRGVSQLLTTNHHLDLISSCGRKIFSELHFLNGKIRRGDGL